MSEKNDKAVTKETKSEDAVSLPEGFTKENIEIDGTLPSGKKILVKKGKGRHLRNAQRMMTGGSNNSDIARALATYLCTIDGAYVNLEDFDNMDLPDVIAIEAHFLGIASASITS